MGWKLAVVIAKLDSLSLESFLEELYASPVTLEPSDVLVDSAFYFYERLSQRFAWEHRGLGWIVDWKLVESSFKQPLKTTHPLWTFGLQSTVNWYGMSQQAGGEFIRSKSGSSDDGIVTDVGEPGDVERQFVSAFSKAGEEDVAMAAWRDSEITFDGKYEDMTHDGMGEDVVLDLLEHVTGIPLGLDRPESRVFMQLHAMKLTLPTRSFLGRIFR
jgi:hypothetical protein